VGVLVIEKSAENSEPPVDLNDVKLTRVAEAFDEQEFLLRRPALSFEMAVDEPAFLPSPLEEGVLA